jgi:phosphomannomutase
MKPLNKSVAGIRGIWGENLTPATAVKFAAAFGTYLKQGKVLIGRDTRASGELLTQAAMIGLASAGCDVTDIGIVPTPTCQLAVEKNIVDGGIVITASHNPGEWNGLKFLNREGHFLNQPEYEAFIRIYDSDMIAYASRPSLQQIRQGAEFNQDAIQLHIHELLKRVNVQKIREKRYRVALDAVNGAGSRLLIPLLESLGCSVVPVFCDETGEFPRGPEPMPEHLTVLCRQVKQEKADLGLAVDPDADRLSLVTAEGKPLGEEMTLPLCARHWLSKGNQGPIVTNLSTSMSIDHVAREFDRPVIRTKIGEAHVVTGMKENRCPIGGEGNGGVILPAVHYARDTGVGTVLILESMAASSKQLTELAAEIPSYALVKKKMDVPLEKIPGILEILRSEYRDAQLNDLDGIKAVWNNRWLHIRKSGTEGMLRIFAEAPNQETAEQMADKTIALIQSKFG